MKYVSWINLIISSIHFNLLILGSWEENVLGINLIISPHLGVFLGIIRVWTGRKHSSGNIVISILVRLLFWF